MASTTYLKYDNSNSRLQVYIGGARSASFESDGGILHGSWNVEASLVTSDRRLKTNIVPLQRTLRDVVKPRGEQKVSGGVEASGQGPSRQLGQGPAGKSG